MRRLVSGLAVMLLVLIPLLGGADRAQAQSGYVTWVVDHRAKTITVTAKIAVHAPPCGPADTGPGKSGGCPSSIDKIAKEIRGDIETVWNDSAAGGRHYRCYRLIFKVDVQVVDGGSDVPADRVGIRIDRTTQGMRSHVTSTLASGLSSEYLGTYLSNDPSDRLEPSNNILVPSEWAYPPIGKHSYAHEYGHILGLDHYYVESTGELRPGAPVDVMYDQNRRTISQETIDRVVERNRDRLRDRQGQAVQLGDLVCDLRYLATLKATDLDYEAINWFVQATGPGCEPPSEFTLSRSTQQRITVQSEAVVLHVVDAPSVDYLGYSLAGVPDRLRDLWGLSQRFLEDPGDTAFAMPVTIRVSRSIDTPARGEKPPIKRFGPEACSDNEPTEVSQPDCGDRSFKAWMAIVQQGLESIWTGSAPVPMHLGALGGAAARLDRLYKDCPGPLPWPGTLAEDPDATVVKGTLPSHEDIERVAREWTSQHKPGRFDIKGTARRNTSEVGRLRNHSYSWTLTLCPMDKDDAMPAGCP